jgi:hypothetical protein
MSQRIVEMCCVCVGSLASVEPRMIAFRARERSRRRVADLDGPGRVGRMDCVPKAASRSFDS